MDREIGLGALGAFLGFLVGIGVGFSIKSDEVASNLEDFSQISARNEVWVCEKKGK